MKRCDVLIVGGGPAGSTCATALVAAGLDVIVADKAEFPRDKVCAGWITPAVAEELTLDLADYARGRTLEPIRGFVVGRMGDRMHLHRYGEPMSYGIRRCEFDDYLLRRSGARLELGKRITSIARRGRRWIVGEEFEADLLVGAGGHFCPVARALGGESDGARIAAEECEFAFRDDDGGCAIEAGVPELYFTRDLTGYGWAFRKENFLNIGLGVRVGSDSAAARSETPVLRRRVESFVRFLVEQGRIRKAPEARMVGHAYLLRPDSRRQSCGDGFLLVGDAAGLAYDRSGEGIRCAVESGILAARAIRDALSRGPGAASDLSAYQEALDRRFGAVGQGGWDPSDLLPASLRSPVAAMLMRTSWFSRRVMLERWFLHAGEQALAPVVPVSASPAVFAQAAG